MNVRKAETADICAIADIEKEVFPDAWSENAVRETMRQNTSLVFAAREAEGTPVLGYVIFYYVLDEGEIARIACASKYRRKGIGSLLLRALEEESREKGIRLWHLDVRKSNEAARAFYCRHGFREDGIRKGFYENPKEDAVLMTRILETLSAVQDKTRQI